MKKLLLASGAALLAAVPALALQQAPVRQQAQPMTRAAVQAQVQAHFARADADRDGFITQAEAKAAAAQRRASRPERKGPHGQQRAARANPRVNLFERLDANRDGAITQAEAQAVAAQAPQRQGARGAGLFARLDANKDGSVTRAEFDARAAARANRGAKQGQRGNMMAKVDADGDGRISLAEMTAQRLAHFDRMDSNRDGTVTPEERRAARAQRQGRHG